jgi:hypothetical protein
MGESTERKRQKEWADELRSEIGDLQRGVDDSAPQSPREFTDHAAAEAGRAEARSRSSADDDAPS